MAAHRVHNFNAGPAALPLNVLEKLQKEFLDFQGCGMNVMEVSHRGKEFEPIIRQAEKDMRELMQIPANYKVLFMQGGGTAQFSAVPLNLLGDKKKADYIITGGWSKKAAEEAAKYCEVHVVASSEKINFTAIPSADSFNFTQDGSSAYVYYCANETVHGVEFADIPAVPAGTTLVADVSSDFLSSKLDVSRFGLIYAGAQKNVGPSGVTVVIVREDLLGKAAKTCPLVLDYKVYAQNESMYNTPPTWSIYVTGEVLKHLLNIGGLDAVAATNLAKSNLLYSALDESKIYKPLVAREHRSKMNVVFHVADKSGKRDPTLEKKLADKATEAGFIGIAGHRSVGGMRVSLYNAVTLESTKALVAFLKNFEADVLA